MNYIDYIIIGCAAFFLIKGLVRGFFSETLGLVGLIVALICATKYMSNLSDWIDHFIKMQAAIATVLSFVIIFFAVFLIFHLVAHFLEKLFDQAHLGWLEKLAGACVGFFKGVTIVSLLLMFLSLVPFGVSLIPGLPDSRLYEPVRHFAPKMFNFITTIVPGSKSFYGECKESLGRFSPGDMARNTQSFLKALQNNESPQDSHSHRGERPR
jgi:membrane protein required for colicin V production